MPVSDLKHQLDADLYARGLRTCGCSDPACDLIVCIQCGASDCKWPGKCDGKCAECGTKIPTKAEYWAGDTSSPPSSTCSSACSEALWQRYVADGTAVSLSDLTPEQINEMFQTMGLQLEGVGKRTPS